jgi:hypothetical protein
MMRSRTKNWVCPDTGHHRGLAFGAIGHWHAMSYDDGAT